MRFRLVPAGLLLAVGAVAPAAGATGWFPPDDLQVLSYTGVTASIDRDGTARAVVSAGDSYDPGPLNDWARPRDGSWQAIGPADLPSGGVLSTANESGARLAGVPGDPPGTDALAVREDGRWSLSGPLGSFTGGEPRDVALNARGDALAAWSDAAGLHVAARPRGGKWTTRMLGGPGAVRGAPDVVLNDAGDAIVVWARPVAPTRGQVMAATRRAGASWSRSQGVTAISNPRQTQATLDAAGNALVYWISGAATTSALRYSERPAGGARWSAPGVLATKVRSAALRLDGSGDALAVWNAGRYPAASASIASRSMGGRWSRPARLPESIIVGAVAVNERGDAVLLTSDPNFSTPQTPSAWRRPAGTAAWQPELRGVGRSQGGGGSRLAINSAGDAVALWAGYGTVSNYGLPYGVTVYQAPTRPRILSLRAASAPDRRVVAHLRMDAPGRMLATVSLRGARRVVGAFDITARKGDSLVRLPARVGPSLRPGVAYTLTIDTGGAVDGTRAMTFRAPAQGWTGYTPRG